MLKYYTGFLCFCILILKVFSSVGKNCDSSEVITNGSCEDTEICVVATNTCQCKPNYVPDNATCIKVAPPGKYDSLVDNEGSGSLIAGILVPVCLLLFVICSIYINRKYELVKWVRQHFNQRGRNYDEFMIGQDDDDDPPLV